MAEDEYPLPSVLAARVRKERGKPYDMHKLYKPDAASLNNLRKQVRSRLTSYQPPRLNAKEALEDIKYREANRAPRGPPRPRRLPPKEGMDELYNLVQNMRRDIRLIKDAQSKAGAEDWIIRNGQQENLYVEDKDIDGDGTPDIVVKTRDGRKPYIVKGYTTDQSSYPQRYYYFNKYPLKDDRKGHSMRDFYEEQAIDGYTNDGYTRVLNKDAVELLSKARSAGYKTSLPRTNMTSNQVFKQFIVKPIIRGYKEFIKEHYPLYQLNLTGLTVRNAEVYLRDNLVTAEVLKMIYGEEELSKIPGDYWKKLANRKDIKIGCEKLIRELVINRNNIMAELILPIFEYFESQGQLIPEDASGLPMTDFIEDFIGYLVNKPYWQRTTLKAP
jgi:hypothetical protein